MLEGEISEINLVERLVELWREQFTGAIRFENDGIIKIVYFKSGDVLSASTNDRSDSIDEILMRAGKVSREHVKQALAKRKENETLGDALLNLGFITRKELTWARRVQVVGVIRSIAAWENGSFTIVADYLPKRDEGTLFPLPQILVELIVTDQDRLKVERALEGGEAVFTKTADFDAVFRRLGLNEDADAIVAEVDGSRSAAEVATASGKDGFNVYKLLHALATLGVLTREQKAQAEPQFSLEDFSGAGVADAADIWSEPPSPSLPTLELDINNNSAPEPEINVSSYDSEPQFQTSAWDDEEEPVQYTPAETPRMPAWDAPPPVAAVPMPASIEPPADPEEEAWGFDEAQIETAQRATSIPPIPPPAPSVVASGPHLRPARAQKEPTRSRFGLLVALFVIAILAGAGYFGFAWWQGRQDAAATIAETQPQPRTATSPFATNTNTATVVEATPTTTAPATNTVATDTVATSTTSTVAPTPTPVVTTGTTPPTTTAPSPSVATTTTTTSAPRVATTTPPTANRQPPTATPTTATSALPAVVRRTDTSRARYDAMAANFAANKSGNFTVQLQILCETSNLDKAMRTGGDRIWFVPQTIGTRSCFRLNYGRYDTRAAAQQGLNEVPASLRDKNSAIRAITK